MGSKLGIRFEPVKRGIWIFSIVLSQVNPSELGVRETHWEYLESLLD